MKWKICRINLLRFDCFYMQHFNREREKYFVYSLLSITGWQFWQCWNHTQIVGVFCNGKNNHFELEFRTRGSILIRFTHMPPMFATVQLLTLSVPGFKSFAILFLSRDFRFITQRPYHTAPYHSDYKILCVDPNTYSSWEFRWRKTINSMPFFHRFVKCSSKPHHVLYRIFHSLRLK